MSLTDMVNASKWSKKFNVGHPIFSQDLSSFSKWAMYGGFKKRHNSGERDKLHTGHDFIAYLDKDEKEHMCLPPNTPVRAIADGIVRAIFSFETDCKFYEGYLMYVIIQHNMHGLASGYGHVVPHINIGDNVRRGQTIATLYDTSVLYPDKILPTHLHFELGCNKLNKDSFELVDLVDPLKMIPGLKEISVKGSSLY